MNTFVNEQTVMQYYLDCMNRDDIEFLKGRDEYKTQIGKLIAELMAAETMNAKIQVAVSLWKKLFEASMSSISPDKRGYDKLFKYFDAYVEFEELIFASDSFYRDHTLHCIWVYFLGEYVKRQEQFSPLFDDMRTMAVTIDAIDALGISHARATAVKNLYSEFIKLSDAVRCVSALTHDLGYPLKKISKINKSMSKVLPFFAVNEYTDFKFDFGSVQQEFIDSFIDFISRGMSFSINLSEETQNRADVEEVAEKIQRLLSEVYEIKTDSDGISRPTGVNYEAITAISPEDRQLIWGLSSKVCKFFIPHLSAALCGIVC